MPLKLFRPSGKLKSMLFEEIPPWKLLLHRFRFNQILALREIGVTEVRYTIQPCICCCFKPQEVRFRLYKIMFSSYKGRVTCLSLVISCFMGWKFKDFIFKLQRDSVVEEREMEVLSQAAIKIIIFMLWIEDSRRKQMQTQEEDARALKRLN